MLTTDSKSNIIIWIIAVVIVLLVVLFILGKIKKKREKEEKLTLKLSLKRINRKKAIVSLTAVVIVLLTIFLANIAINKIHEVNRTPILQVALKGTGVGILPGNKYYYIVYDNGDYKKVDEFPISEVEVYHLYSLNDTHESEDNADLYEMPPYAEEIIEYADSIANSNLVDLYVINDRYFFSIDDSRTVNKKYSSALYEYLPDKNKAKKIVSFENGYIQHVEYYQESK